MVLFEYSMIAIGLVTAGVGVLAATKRRRPVGLVVAVLASLLAASLLATAISRLDPSSGLGPAILVATVLAHPMLVYVTYAYLEDSPVKKLPVVAALFLGGIGVSYFALRSGATMEALYATFPMNVLFAACYGLAVAEPISAWIRLPMLRTQAYAMLFAAILLVVTGPILTFELGALRLPDLQGYVWGAPAIVALQLWAVRSTDGLPLRHPRTKPRGVEPSYRMERGTFTILQEKRPKYARALFASLVLGGQPGLLVSRNAEAIQARYRIEVDGGALATDRYAVLRFLATVREFARSARGGVIYLEDLPEIVAVAGMEEARAVLSSLRRTARTSGTTVIVSAHLLVPPETEQLRRAGFTLLGLPNVEDEVAFLVRSTLGGEEYLLDGYCDHVHRRREDLDLWDVPGLEASLAESLSAMGRVSLDPTVLGGMEEGVGSVTTALQSFRRQSLESLGQGDWPSRRALREPLAPRRVPATIEEREVLPAVERAFVEVYGEVGRFMLARELAQLDLDTRSLSTGEVAALLERIRSTAALLEEAVDGPGTVSLEDKADLLEHKLIQISGGRQ